MGKIRRTTSSAGDRLRPYRQKRAAGRTPEPFGGARAAPGRPSLFVVQKHAARRLHWDLRLEFDGVLRSWAVPRGPSLDPADKRMAVLTEDHPLEYVEFEGVIPEGNYGAGAMIVWDRGTWTPVDNTPDEGFAAGKLLFELHGYKLRGLWTLVRTRGETGKEWLLIKKPDGAASTAGALPPGEESVLSGLTVEELARGTDRVVKAHQQLERLRAQRRPVDPSRQEVMKAQVAGVPFSAADWLFELKYDGWRMLIARDGDEVTLRYRSGIDGTASWPELVRTLRALPYRSFVMDGEVVVLDDDGRPNFQRLQRRAKRSQTLDVQAAELEHPATLYVFDLLAFEGWDLRELPLVARKDVLRNVLPRAGPVRYAEHIEAKGEALFRHVVDLGLEGIIAKKADSRYVGGRSANWLKIRVDRSDDFVIVGYTRGEGSRTGFGALHVATHVDGELTYAGRVGSGFDERMLDELTRRLAAIRRERPACTGVVPKGKQHTWVAPVLVCEVRFREVTDDGLLRQPVFLRMREDKRPDECARHGPEIEPVPRESTLDHDSPGSAAENGSVRRSEPDSAGRRPTVDELGLTITNPDKIFWPDDGYTKRDLVEYYRAVGPWLLPYLRDRPLVLTRYPDGIDGKSFFQKNAPPYARDFVRTETMWSEHGGREIDYFICESVEDIAYVANMGAIPLHVWASRIDDVQHPDWCILDLDPKGAPFSHVIRVAKEIRSVCDSLEFPCFVKTSGSTGLHVLLPLDRVFTHEQSQQLGHVVARVIVDRLPDIATIERALAARMGRVYVDYLQNGHGRLLVAPYSVRPLPRAPVSTPLRWSEVRDDLDIGRFTIATVPRRLARLRSDPLLDVFHTRPDLERMLAGLAELL